MEPGRATNTPPQFPEAWCGLWKDPLGKVMFVEQQAGGRQLFVSFAAGIQQNFYPIPDSPFGTTRRLSGIYQLDMYGAPSLQIDIGDPHYGPRYDIHFVFGEGDRLRTAESWDIVSGIIARPKLAMGSHVGGEENTTISWAYPLSNYWKTDEEELHFRNFHGW
jgi:hypothetical protein